MFGRRRHVPLLFWIGALFFGRRILRNWQRGGYGRYGGYGRHGDFV